MKSIKLSYIRIPAFFVLAGFSFFSWASDSVLEAAPDLMPSVGSNQTPDQTLDQTSIHLEALAEGDSPEPLLNQAVNALMIQVEKTQKSELTAAQKNERYQLLVERLIAPLVDFELIAKRVMGKYGSLATDLQKEAFTSTFRTSLLSTYTQAVSTYSNQQVNLLPFKGVEQRGALARAQVDMNIMDHDGSLVPVNYAMYSRSSSPWRLENLTLNGVNLGLTFRSQFEQALRLSRGSIDQVIEGWQIGQSEQPIAENNQSKVKFRESHGKR